MDVIAEVTLTRSGGFAGLSRRVSLKPDTLAPATREKALRLIEAVVAAGRRPASARAPQADRFQFDVEVDRGGRRESFVFHEDDAPRELQALFALASDLPK